MDEVIATKNLKKKKIECDIYQLSKTFKQDERKFVNLLCRYQVLVDCIFGTGLNRQINGNLKKIIEKNVVVPSFVFLIKIFVAVFEVSKLKPHSLGTLSFKVIIDLIFKSSAASVWKKKI